MFRVPALFLFWGRLDLFIFFYLQKKRKKNKIYEKSTGKINTLFASP